MLRALPQVAQGADVMTERALVIGASGGIGAALAAGLAARGALVTRLSRANDGFDITDPAVVSARMTALESPFDTILIASGILAPEGARPEKSLAAIDAAHMSRVMAVNAIGPALVLSHVPRLLPRDTPRKVGVLTARAGSIGDNGLGGWYSYRAAMAAANQIVYTAAIEISRQRKQAVLVALHPGTVETPFTKGCPGHRKPAPDDLQPPPPPEFEPDAVIDEVLDLVEARFGANFGDPRPFGFATNRTQALQVLDHFIAHALPSFGDCQDAMIAGEPWLWHAVISPYLNIGLLDPLEACRRAEAARQDGAAPLNAVEGVIRQIIGWREFVRGICFLEGPDYTSQNALGHDRPLPGLS